MVPEIVAHRGDAEHFPENSLPAIEAAWRHGLRHVEFDVQLSSDAVPYVVHDASLERTTGSVGDVRFMNSGQLDGVDAGEPARFGRLHAGTPLPRLSAVAALMTELGPARAFVELKRASLAHHGHAACVERILAALAPVIERCVLISFDADACRLAREAAGIPVGWVLDGEPRDLLPALESLRPQFVFCDHRRLPVGLSLPEGEWTWVAYEVREAAHAMELAARGVAMVESMAPFRLAAALATLAGAPA